MSSSVLKSPLSPFHDEAVVDTYEGVKLLIYKVAQKYAAINNVPVDEVISAAHMIFMKAFHYHYRPKTGKRPATFSTRLHNSLQWELVDYMRKESKHRGHLEVNEELVGATDTDTNFRVALESELSDDAKHIVRLILDTPDDINALFKWEGVTSRKGCLRALKEHLEDCGWGARRIAESFNELRTILTS